MIELQTVWGWQPALYLFLGGLGAGSFVVAALVHLITRKHTKVVAVAMWCAIGFLAVGLGLLLLELSAPLRALMMWQSFSHLESSWMALGAWLLFAGIIVCGLAAVANTAPLVRFLHLSEGLATGVGTACSALGAVIALGVAVYTGILLMSAPGVPFWNTPWLPALFTVSALDTGVAFVALLFAIFEPNNGRLGRVLEVFTLCLIVTECCVLAVFITGNLAGGTPLFESLEPGYAATAAASALAWTDGQLFWAFWGLLIVIGLAIPFVLSAVQLRFGHTPAMRVVCIVDALCVLTGGCTLRFITLLAGAHVDIVVNTVSTLLL